MFMDTRLSFCNTVTGEKVDADLAYYPRCLMQVLCGVTYEVMVSECMSKSVN